MNVFIFYLPRDARVITSNEFNDLQEAQINNRRVLYVKYNDYLIIIPAPPGPERNWICPTIDEISNWVQQTFNHPTIKIKMFRHPQHDNELCNGVPKDAITIQGKFNNLTGERNASSLILDILRNTDNQRINILNILLEDPLIIVVTRTEYGEWQKFVTKWADLSKKLKALDKKLTALNSKRTWNNNTTIIELNLSPYTFLYINEDMVNSTRKIDDFLLRVLKKWGKGLQRSDIYVAVHDLDNYIEDVNRFKDRVACICDFHHTEPDKSFCDLLVNVIDNIDKNNRDEAIKNCKEIISKLVKKTFPYLTHQIARLFLPLDIDLQGISEVLKRNDEKQARQYYEEAFGNNGRMRLESKIDEAKNLIKELPVPNDKKNYILQLFEDNELKKAKEALQNWDKTKGLLQQQNPFHSCFCKLMECLKNLGEK